MFAAIHNNIEPHLLKVLEDEFKGEALFCNQFQNTEIKWVALTGQTTVWATPNWPLTTLKWVGLIQLKYIKLRQVIIQERNHQEIH